MLDEGLLNANLDDKVKLNNECDKNRNTCNLNLSGLVKDYNEL